MDLGVKVIKCGTIESCVDCPIAPELNEMMLGDETTVSLGDAVDRLRFQNIGEGTVKASMIMENILPTEERVEAVTQAVERLKSGKCKQVNN